MAKFSAVFKKFKEKYLFGSEERASLKRLSRIMKPFSDRGNHEIVLIDIPDYANELIEQLMFAKYFVSKGYQPRQYYPSIHLSSYDGIGGALKRKLALLSRGQRFARRMGIDDGLNHTNVSKDICHRARGEAIKLRQKLTTKLDLIEYRIEGVDLGVAVYDTYLRIHSEPTVDLECPDLFQTIYQAFLTFFAVKLYFESNPVRVVVLGHAVYNNWKILSDYAVSIGVDVYVTYNSRIAPIHHVNKHRGLQTTDHSSYSADFNYMPVTEQNICRARGRELMAKRVSGSLDHGLFYMPFSAFGEAGAASSSIQLHHGKRPLVMMLHSFFDSPHVYQDMIFPDFWVWCYSTLEYVKNQGLTNKYQLYLKPHPNRLNGEDEIIDKLVSDFPFVVRLKGSESNHRIIELKPAAIITVYGTVAAEFAFLAIPVITCGDNPTSSFSFCYQARSETEYFRFLDIADTLVVNENMQSEVAEYAYMHYLQSYGVNVKDYPFKRHVRTVDNGRFISRVGDLNYTNFAQMVGRALDK